MAYLRKEQKKYGTYLSIVEAYRDKDGKSQQRRIANLGNIKNFSEKSLLNIARSLYELAGGNPEDLPERQLEEISRHNYGFVSVYSKLLKAYGFDKIFLRLSRKHKLSYSLFDVVLLMIVERLNEPSSKRRNYFNQGEYLGIDQEVKLQYLYRSLDLLTQYSDLIQDQIYTKGRDLFNMELDVVFYDVTTLYFESEVVNPGSLRQMGFGKDGKIGHTQIVFTMLIDKDQQPIGYEIFEGNQYEGHTMATALERLKNKYQIGKIIVVADRGMLSKSNLTQIVSNGYEYIIGERLRTLPKQVKQYLLDLNNYSKLNTNTASEDSIRYCQIEYGNRTIIATHSNKRASKDRHQREEKIAKAQQLLKNPSKIKAKAYRHFLKSDGNQLWELDEDKIKQDALFDGILSISTNTVNLKAEQVLAQYTQLHKIENTFRTFKHHLELRPIFHWTNSRIKGHICMAYISYTLLNRLKIEMRKCDIPVTEGQLRNHIGKMQLSLVNVNGTNLYMRSALTPVAKQVSKALKIKSLPNYIHPEALPEYL